MSAAYLQSSFASLVSFQQRVEAPLFSKLSSARQLRNYKDASSFVKKEKNHKQLYVQGLTRKTNKALVRSSKNFKLRRFLNRANNFRRRKFVLSKLRRYFLTRKRGPVFAIRKLSLRAFATKTKASGPTFLTNDRVRVLKQEAVSRSSYYATVKPLKYVFNRFYKRVFLRRRLRGALLVRLRGKLKRTSPLVLPSVFEIGQKKPYYSKKIY